MLVLNYFRFCSSEKVFILPLFLKYILTGYRNLGRDFPGGAVVKNPPANAGDTGSSPSPGRSHMPHSN